MKGQMQKVAAAAGVPCDVIPMADYGMVNGKNVLAFAKKLANA
jgi:PTS system cellobiose-specific IIB component